MSGRAVNTGVDGIRWAMLCMVHRRAASGGEPHGQPRRDLIEEIGVDLPSELPGVAEHSTVPWLTSQEVSEVAGSRAREGTSHQGCHSLDVAGVDLEVFATSDDPGTTPTPAPKSCPSSTGTTTAGGTPGSTTNDPSTSNRTINPRPTPHNRNVSTDPVNSKEAD